MRAKIAALFLAPTLLAAGVVFDIGGIDRASSLATPDFTSAVYRTLDQQFLFAPDIVATVTKESFKTAVVVTNWAELVHNFDRRAYLAHLFKRITAGAATDEEQVILWTRWLQDYMGHSASPPLDPDGDVIYDPIWLLKHRLAHCGQTNRVLIDGLTAAGFKTRLIQFADHVGAEVSFGGAWHYIDADLFSFGEFIRNEDGSIASMTQILENPDLLGKKTHNELAHYRNEVRALYKINERYAQLRHTMTTRELHFGKMITPYAWVKIATLDQETDKHYGWKYYRAEPLSD